MELNNLCLYVLQHKRTCVNLVNIIILYSCAIGMQTKTNALLKEYIIREKVLKLQCKSLQFLNILECNKRTKNRKKRHFVVHGICRLLARIVHFVLHKGHLCICSVKICQLHQQQQAIIWTNIYLLFLFNWFLCNHTVFSNFTLTIDIEIWNSLERVKSFYFCNFSWNVADKRKCPRIAICWKTDIP